MMMESVSSSQSHINVHLQIVPIVCHECWACELTDDGRRRSTRFLPNRHSVQRCVVLEEFFSLSKKWFHSCSHTVESFLILVLWVVGQERGKLGTGFWRHTNFSWQGNPVCSQVSRRRVVSTLGVYYESKLFIMNRESESNYESLGCAAPRHQRVFFFVQEMWRFVGLMMLFVGLGMRVQKKVYRSYLWSVHCPQLVAQTESCIEHPPARLCIEHPVLTRVSTSSHAILTHLHYYAYVRLFLLVFCECL